MTDTLVKATNLWKAIVKYANAHGEVEGHGNSGEFHNSNQHEKLQKEEDEALTKLRFEFFNLTDFMPHQNDDGDWYLR